MEKISRLKHLFVTVFLSNFAFNVVTPAITDITMDAICPSQDKCSLAIYLSGFQQAIIGLGSMLMMPLIGNLSDVYGRKTLLTIPVTLLIFPSVIMAYRRTTNYFYAYYVMRTLTGMLSDTGIQCISIAYAADCMSEENRASAIATLAGVGSAAFLCSNFVVRFLSTAQIFLVSSISSSAALLYMTIFLKDNINNYDALNQSILANHQSDHSEGTTVHQIINLLNTSTTLLLATLISILYGLGEGGIQSPFLMLIDSIAWAAWVPYVVALFPMFFFLAKPALQSIVSKQVGPNEQIFSYLRELHLIILVLVCCASALLGL
nr:hippocampus abundant transcript-like protein 1 isoform X3 [Solanum lycopersicum]